MYTPDNSPQKRGKRAENVASWYFRLNGFLSIPSFILHPDQVQRHPLTEADLIAVRFPYSAEVLDDRSMDDDRMLLKIDETRSRIVFILVEVKVDTCNINGPWSDQSRGNMQRVIRRLGFVDEAGIDGVASGMYKFLRWENDKFVLQYVAVGSRRNNELQNRYAQLVQITFDDISDFLLGRFRNFPQKLPTGSVYTQWPKFGRYYGSKIREILNESTQDPEQRSRNIITGYIDGT